MSRRITIVGAAGRKHAGVSGVGDATDAVAGRIDTARHEPLGDAVDLAQREQGGLSFRQPGRDDMTTLRLITNSLRFYWRTHLGVVAAAAVTSSVLLGALLLGDLIVSVIAAR